MIRRMDRRRRRERRGRKVGRRWARGRGGREQFGVGEEGVERGEGCELGRGWKKPRMSRVGEGGGSRSGEREGCQRSEKRGEKAVNVKCDARKIECLEVMTSRHFRL